MNILQNFSFCFLQKKKNVWNDTMYKQILNYKKNIQNIWNLWWTVLLTWHCKKALFTNLILFMSEKKNNESISLVKFKVKVMDLSNLVSVLPVKTQYFTLGSATYWWYSPFFFKKAFLVARGLWRTCWFCRNLTAVAICEDEKKKNLTFAAWNELISIIESHQ